MVRGCVGLVIVNYALALEVAGVYDRQKLLLGQEPFGRVLSSVGLPPEAHDYPGEVVPPVARAKTAQPTSRNMSLPRRQTPIDVHIPAIGSEKHRLPITVETVLAVTFVVLIASTPFIMVALDNQPPSRLHIVQSIVLFIWLGGAIYLFTNVIWFNSYHFSGERRLTLVETIYLLSQIVTTVGYGDITPSRPRGQVVIGICVLLSLLLISHIVSHVAAIVTERTEEFSKHIASQVVRSKSSSSSPVSSAEGSTTPLPSAASETTHHWLKVGKPASPPLGPLLGASASFLFFVLVGVLFYHLCPGEDKTLLEAVYFSVITLSTVGFGALTATTEMGKVFGAFWMLFGVGALGGLMAAFSQTVMELKELEKWDFATKREEFEALSVGFQMKTPLGGASQRIDQRQFLMFGLIHAGVATKDDFDRFERLFQRIGPDVDDGTVTLGAIEQFFQHSESRRTGDQSPRKSSPRSVEGPNTLRNAPRS